MRQNTIYLIALDSQIPKDLVGSFMAYVAAFYHGVPCKKARPGTKLRDKAKVASGTGQIKAVVPEDFATDHEVPTREYKGD